MLELLKKFEDTPPEIVFEWKDPETDAIGWVVINSLRGGAAGGGTRMRVGLEKSEVISLAKTMEVKFTVSGPPIGGAKSGINFDPQDPRKDGVLRRWFTAVQPLLKYYYGTGGDLNIDEINEVIPITEDNGVWHPQEGVFKGHFHPTEAQMVNRIGQLRLGVKKPLEDPMYTPNVTRKYTVADMITGFGVAESVQHYYSIWGGELQEKRAVIQGWGNVGAAAGFYLAQKGVKIVGIVDKEGGLYNPAGFTLKEVISLYLSRERNRLVSPDMLSYEEIMNKIWNTPFEIFIPAAASRLVTKEHVQAMIDSKIEVISSGANVPFKDSEFLFGEISNFADSNIALIPDFIANCGMARVFAYLMESDDVSTEDVDIFNDSSVVIKQALEKVHALNNSSKDISKTALNIALQQLL